MRLAGAESWPEGRWGPEGGLLLGGGGWGWSSGPAETRQPGHAGRGAGS